MEKGCLRSLGRSGPKKKGAPQFQKKGKKGREGPKRKGEISIV